MVFHLSAANASATAPNCNVLFALTLLSPSVTNFINSSSTHYTLCGCLLYILQPPMRIPLFSWHFAIPMICLLSIIGFCISAVSGQCLGDQRSLLPQLKNNLVFDSSSSTKLVHWNQSVDCCSWEGVSCNKGRVIGLDLKSESISEICKQTISSSS